MEGSASLSKATKDEKAWRDFKSGQWRDIVDARDFIVRNVTSYAGDETFLAGPSKRTKAVWAKLQPYFKEEQKKGVLAADAKTPSTLLAHKAGYIDRKNEVIVGLQTDEPFKRAIFPYGGLRMVENGLKAAGFDADPPGDEAVTQKTQSHKGGAFDAVEWTYLAYLGAVKEANGAAMPVGRISSFLDIYIERDLSEGTLDESGAQELWDQLVQKLRIVRFLRTPEYDALFSGDPYWATECVGGISISGEPLVTKSSYRMLHTLTNLGPAPEPNITVLWSKQLPETFKRYCVNVSKQTSSLQYENDDLMRPLWGDDYGIACCVSAMKLGKQMQFFGARVNLAKALLYAINGGRDEISGDQIAPPAPPITGDVLDFGEVMESFDRMMEWLARTYVHAMNCIHYMHDKYFFERARI